MNPKDRYTVATWPVIHLNDSFYDVSKHTLFYIHGWTQSANDSRLDDLRDAILTNVDVNVVLVDWGTTSNLPYVQAVSNSRIVAAQLTRLCNYLINKGSSPSQFHLIGISLGAHIAAYVAKSIPEIYRITGLDPAQPLFHGYNKEVRLHKDDAWFVEVAHTNGRPAALLGFGIYEPIGDVDFYFNGGWDQPGCINDGNYRAFAELEAGNYSLREDLHVRLFCPHVRSLLYYIEAIGNLNCLFWGVKRHSSSTVINILSGGYLARSVTYHSDCTIESCTPFGLYTVSYPARGTFDVATSYASPFCIKQPEVDAKMAEQLTNYSSKHNNEY
ncbi:phospholipase A1-like isoform X2 [Periplaneta americana]